MPSFDVAHVREQGQSMLLFPLDSSFGHKTDSDKQSILNDLEAHAHGAGLGGRAAAVWQNGNSTYTFGPPNWRGFLSSISMRFVLANVNKKISW